MKKVIFSLLAALCFAACTQNDVEELSSNRVYLPDQISVGFENDDTRIQLSNGKTVWNEADRISVFYQSFDNLMWEFQGVDGDRTGTFELIDGKVGEKMMDDVIVVYPYNADYLVNVNTKSVEASIPALQNYYPESYDPESNLMISLGDDSNFVLKNVSGWVKIQLTGNGEEVQYITLRGNNDELLAGDVYLSASDASLSFASGNDSSADDDLEVGGDLVFDSAEQKSITLECYNTTLSSEPKAFYIALAPQNFENGFTVEVKCKGYAPMVLNNTATTTIERNHIKPMEAVAFESESVAEYDVLFEAQYISGLYYDKQYGNGYNYYAYLSDANIGEPGGLSGDYVIYALDIYSDTPADEIATLPQGEYILDTDNTAEPGTFGYEYSHYEQKLIDSELNVVKFKEGTLVITENYIEAVLLLENGEWHKVIYSGNLALIPEISTYEQIGIVGSFNEWRDDLFMQYDEVLALYYAHNLWFDEGCEFKLRKDADWEVYWGAEGQSYINTNSYMYLTQGGNNNIVVRESGYYDIYFSLQLGVIFFMEPGVDINNAVEDTGDDDVNNGDEYPLLDMPNIYTFEPGLTSAYMAWEPVENAAGYEVYLYPYAYPEYSYQTLLDADTTEYTFEDLTAGYYNFGVYAVAADDSGYNDSDSSAFGYIWIEGNPQPEVDWFSVEVYSKTDEELGIYPSNSMYFTWNGANVKTLRYGIFEYTANELKEFGWHTIYDNLNYISTDEINHFVNGSEYYFEGLAANTTWTFVTYAVNYDGEEFLSYVEYTTEDIVLSENTAKWLGEWRVTTYKTFILYGDGSNEVVDGGDEFTLNITASSNDPNELYVDGLSVLGEGWPVPAYVDNNGDLYIFGGTAADIYEDNIYYYWVTCYQYDDTSNDSYFSIDVAPVYKFSMSSTNTAHGDPVPTYSGVNDLGEETYATPLSMEVYLLNLDTGGLSFLTESLPVNYRSGAMDMVKIEEPAQQSVAPKGLQSYKIATEKKQRRMPSGMISTNSVVFKM
ncbi:MAG: hypothetical protein J6R38_02935 [Alistipes sp.]|nr:hypothetical protein [Alistipes sp.]